MSLPFARGLFYTPLLLFVLQSGSVHDCRGASSRGQAAVLHSAALVWGTMGRQQRKKGVGRLEHEGKERMSPPGTVTALFLIEARMPLAFSATWAHWWLTFSRLLTNISARLRPFPQQPRSCAFGEAHEREPGVKERRPLPPPRPAELWALGSAWGALTPLGSLGTSHPHLLGQPSSRLQEGWW